MTRLIAAVLLSGSLSSMFAAPAIDIVREGSELNITFSGKLQVTDRLGGTWLELTNASPYTESLISDQRFFRSSEAGNESIFSTDSVVSLGLTGPLQTNFSRAYAGMPDGIFPPLRVKEYFDGSLQMGALNIPVSMRVRGNSSLQECSFPKLKFKVSKVDRVGTPFAEAREVKVGTHCAEGGRGNIGRLRDERAAWREALAYETMDLLGFTSQRVRRAIIEYQDTGAPDESGESGWKVTRHAFIAEDQEVLAERLGGRALKDEEISALTNPVFNQQLLADLLMFHALLGNWDFGLPVGSPDLWNTEVIELADKSLLPVAGDFDLASWVTGFVRQTFPGDYRPELQDVERQALYTLEGLPARVGTARFATARERFLAKRTDIEALVNAANVDEEGRANALLHINAFFDALAAVTLK